MGLDGNLHTMLRHLKERMPQIQQVCQMGEVLIRLSVRSDHAQIVYNLMPETLAELAEIGLPLEVSSVSWGEVGI